MINTTFIQVQQLKNEYSQRLINLFFSFFENGISLKPNRQLNEGLLNFVESDPKKTLNNSIFQLKYSQKFSNEFIQSYAFKNFLKDYNKIDLNSTTRFKYILNKLEFENSQTFKNLKINQFFLLKSVWKND